MSLRRMLQVFIAASAATLGALQLLPAPPRTNPDSNPGASIEEQLHPPPGVAAVLGRSCENCHSNRTEWPLYSRIAPVSWSIASDVENARTAMNLSEWGTRIAPQPNRAMGCSLQPAQTSNPEECRSQATSCCTPLRACRKRKSPRSAAGPAKRPAASQRPSEPPGILRESHYRESPLLV